VSRALPFFAVLSLGFAPAPFPKRSTPVPDADAVVGVWQLVSFDHDGQHYPADEVKPIRLTVTRKTMRLSKVGPMGESPGDEWAYSLDPHATPKSMDGKGEGGEHLPWVYRLDRDTLTLCGCTARHVRPKEFTARTGTGMMLMVFKRLKR
jgi:uncharacterized protein (TIGR03067 family)